MPVTVVKCSVRDCPKDADYKIAAPWKGGYFSELKTYGYTCSDHVESMIDYAKKRPKPSRFSTEESVGEIGKFELATQ